MFTHNLSGLYKKYDIIPDVIFRHFYKALHLNMAKIVLLCCTSSKNQENCHN